MGAMKQIVYGEVKEGFSPKSLPEIIKILKNINEHQAIVYQRNKKEPFLFETDRLIIRRFYQEDSQGIYNLSNDRQNSEMKNYDHQWPTDFDSCIGMANWFATNENMWAVCIKPNLDLIGMITYNTVDGNNMIDLGHVWNTKYGTDGLDTEAILLMVQYAFLELGINGVYAYNPLECEKQIAPLKAVGMEITETSKGSFVNDEDGNPIYFTACKMVITKERWNTLC